MKNNLNIYMPKEIMKTRLNIHIPTEARIVLDKAFGRQIIKGEKKTLSYLVAEAIIKQYGKPAKNNKVDEVNNGKQTKTKKANRQKQEKEATREDDRL